MGDLDRSASFYRQAFGWRPRVEVPAYVEFALPDGRGLGLYAREGFALNVGQTPTLAPPGGIGPTELYFHVDDLDAAIGRLKAVGARCLSERTPRDWGDEAAYYADPDRNVLVVVAPSTAPGPKGPEGGPQVPAGWGTRGRGAGTGMQGDRDARGPGGGGGRGGRGHGGRPRALREHVSRRSEPSGGRMVFAMRWRRPPPSDDCRDPAEGTVAAWVSGLVPLLLGVFASDPVKNLIGSDASTQTFFLIIYGAAVAVSIPFWLRRRRADRRRREILEASRRRRGARGRFAIGPGRGPGVALER